MITIQKYQNLGTADHGWLNAHFHFSFGDYMNRERMQFGPLRVINDDIIKAGGGFDFHPHDNMEIITYVRRGAISHEDNLGNKGRTGAGDVQVMSAGSGIIHAEHNRETEDTNLYQIWIMTNQKDVTPQWDAKQFPQKLVQDQLSLLVSGRDCHKDQNRLFIYQDASIFGGKLEEGQEITHTIEQGRRAYILCSYGSFSLNDEILSKGDGAEIMQVETLTFTALEACEIIVIDLP